MNKEVKITAKSYNQYSADTDYTFRYTNNSRIVKVITYFESFGSIVVYDYANGTKSNFEIKMYYINKDD
jgi:hypothetical protein